MNFHPSTAATVATATAITWRCSAAAAAETSSFTGATPPPSLMLTKAATFHWVCGDAVSWFVGFRKINLRFSIFYAKPSKHHYCIHLPTTSNRPKNRINSKISTRKNLKPFLHLPPGHVPLFFYHLSYQSLW